MYVNEVTIRERVILTENGFYDRLFDTKSKLFLEMPIIN